MPIGAVVARPPVWEVFADNPYLHTSTFGGSPLACAAALAALASLQEPHVAESCRARGSQLLEGCRELQATYPETVTAVRGRGLLVALEFADSDLGGLVISGLVQRRVLAAFALNAPQVLRLEPPAIITEKEVQLVLSALRGALADTAALLAD